MPKYFLKYMLLWRTNEKAMAKDCMYVWEEYALTISEGGRNISDSERRAL